MIKDITLTTTFGGGIGGDNWNLDWFCLTNGGNVELLCSNNHDADAKPLCRFTGDKKVLVIPVTR